MQRMYNLDKWTRLDEGEALSFDNPRPRNVRLEVNAPQETALYVADGSGEVHFLALVKGRDTLEFGSSGAFQLTVEGSGLMVYTADGADISHEELGAVSFTKVVERRRRNPELEQLAYMMQQNMERRLAQSEREIEFRLSRGGSPSAVVDAPPRAADRPTEEPVAPDHPRAPAASAAGAGRGSEAPQGSTGSVPDGKPAAEPKAKA